MLSNAIKFSKPNDKITVAILDPRKRSDGLYNFEIRVIDNGLGISPEDRKNLFKPYFRSSDEKSRALNPTSNGIGLTISKQLAQALGGDLTLDEKQTKGCQFVIQLNLEMADLDFDFE